MPLAIVAGLSGLGLYFYGKKSGEQTDPIASATQLILLGGAGYLAWKFLRK